MISLAVLAVMIFLLLLTLDYSIAKTVRIVGTAATGTEVKLDSFRLWLLRGKASINKLSVANPQGYHNPEAFSMTDMTFALNVPSLLSDKIEIEEIVIDGLVINYEPSIAKLTTNLNEIKANVDKFSKTSEKVEEKEATPKETREVPKGAAKKVVIRKFVLRNAKFIISSADLKAGGAIPLPSLELKNLGEEGESIGEVIAEIYGKIIFFALDTATKSGLANIDLSGALDSAGKTGGQLIDSAGKNSGELIDKVKNIFSK